jgi:hypothetical protein
MKHFTLSAASAVALASSALATVSSTLVSDAYTILDGGRMYSVLDIYVKGNHLGDVHSIVSGLSGTSGHPVVFATSQAQGVTRDAAGRVSGGAITSDIFVQAGNSSWNASYTGSEAWDSFVALGNRKQNASVTNRAGSVVALTSNKWVAGSDFTQMNVANSNFINNGASSAWLTDGYGANPYTTGGSLENPFARISLYNDAWASTYTTLDRNGVLNSRGSMFNGANSAGSALLSSATSGAGTSLDFHWMLGRFAIDLTGREGQAITMQVQFNMVGKNGTSNEAGVTFTGATTSAYKVSQFFAFAVPTPGAIALLSVAGLMGRRRSH